MVVVVGPVFQLYVVAPPAVSTVGEPEQTVALLTVTVGDGFTVTVTMPVLLHPAAEVPVTVYEVFVTGETLMVLVVGPVFHVYVDAPLPVSITLCPAQMAAEAEVAATVGNGLTVIT